MEKIIITKENIHKLFMKSIKTHKYLNIKGEKNSFKGEKYAWMSINDIVFNVSNLKVSVFLDIHKVEVVFNNKTNYWNIHSCISDSKHKRSSQVKEFLDKPIINDENMNMNELIILINTPEYGEDILPIVRDNPLLVDNALDIYSVEEFNMKLREIYS